MKKLSSSYDVMIDINNASDNDNEAYVTLPNKELAKEFMSLVHEFARKHNIDCNIEIF